MWQPPIGLDEAKSAILNFK